MWFILIIIGVALMGALLYWLLIITEGVYLGRRIVVWLYDRAAPGYDHIKSYDVEAEAFFVITPLLHRLRHLPSPRILDVATGTGRLPSFLLETPTFNGHVVGLDASRRMLAQAEAKLRPFTYRAALVWGTAVALPFADHSFDALTCLEALEFFPSQSDALREMARVLRPGGLLMVTRRRGWEARTFPGRYYTVDEFATLLTDFGFVQVETLPWQVDYDQVMAWRRSI